MTIAFTIPFWLILILLVIIGIVGMYIISWIFDSGDWDFFTPMIALGWFIIFVVLAIGLALGKLLF